MTNYSQFREAKNALQVAKKMPIKLPRISSKDFAKDVKGALSIYEALEVQLIQQRDLLNHITYNLLFALMETLGDMLDNSPTDQDIYETMDYRFENYMTDVDLYASERTKRIEELELDLKGVEGEDEDSKAFRQHYKNLIQHHKTFDKLEKGHEIDKLIELNLQLISLMDLHYITEGTLVVWRERIHATIENRQEGLRKR